MKLKICGMKYPENIEEIAQLQPDYLGFIFYDKSERYFDGKLPKIDKSIQKVGVFVNATVEEILAKVKLYDLQLVQLHGNETSEFCLLLKQSNVTIIKAFSVGDDFDFKVIQPYESICDYFLFDTKGEKLGGNGTVFDWEILKNYHSKKLFFLSGGIGSADVEKIRKLNLPIYGIDVNSKFEIKPGLKNTQPLIQLQNELSR